MADPSGTTITSLAYTENTYQKKDTAVTHTANTAAGSATRPVYVDANGVATQTTYTLGQNVPVPASGDTSKFLKGDGTWDTPTGTTYSDFTGTNGTAAGVHGSVPAPTTDDANKVLGSSGSWIGAFGAATASAAGTTGLVPAPGIGAEAKVLNGSGQWVDLPTVNNATLTVQLNGTSKGTFTANASSPATININGVEVTDNKLNGGSGNTIAANSSNTDKYPSAKAVYDFVTTQPSAGIPARNTSVCTDTYPCALVAETDGFHWRVMAIGGSQPATGTQAPGACGDAAGTGCNASVQPS